MLGTIAKKNPEYTMKLNSIFTFTRKIHCYLNRECRVFFFFFAFEQATMKGIYDVSYDSMLIYVSE